MHSASDPATTPRLGPAGEPAPEVAVVEPGSEVLARGAPPYISVVLAELAALLARSASGLGFIYQTLDLVTAAYVLDDVAVVVDGSAIGRQVFRRRLRAPGGSPGARAKSSAKQQAKSGLYCEPPVVDPVVARYVTDLVDIALRWDLARRDAGRDALTGLPNRRVYEASLADTVARSRRYGWTFAVVLLDMDDFKAVNDRLGHAGGDEALRAVGVALRSSLRRGDLAARIGGDEFALVILNADSSSVIEALRGRFQTVLDGAGMGVRLRFSAGAASFPADGDELDALMRLADERLYAAKAVPGGPATAGPAS